MKSPGEKAVLAPSVPKLTSAMRVGLGLLLQAHDIAESLRCDKWEFAYEIQALKEAGLNHNDLRSLIRQGLVAHANENSRIGSNGRGYRQAPGLRLHIESCFILSDWGLIVTRQLSTKENVSQPDRNKPLLDSIRITPLWDGVRHELRLGEVIVKRFCQPAKNQEAILAGFQELNWPVRIDDPMTGGGNVDPVERLRDTIKKLNRQRVPLIRFQSDGRGRGIMWELRNRIDPEAM